MKILRIIARLNVGGPARHVVWLTEGLNDGEFESSLIAGTVPPGEEDMSYFAAEHGVRPFFIEEMSRELSLKDLHSLIKIFREIRRYKPDIVHTHTAKAGTVGRLAVLLYRLTSMSARVRVVHTFHGHVFHSYYGRVKTRLFLTIERFLARFVTDRIVVISPQQLEEIHGRFGVGRRDKFEIIPLGIDLGSFDALEEKRHMFRREVGATDDEILVSFVGRLTEIKNLSLYLQVAEMAGQSSIADRPKLRFLIAGDGHMRDRLHTEVRERKLDQSVMFLGTRPDPAAIYAGSDIVALTSLNEGTPLSLIEAMASGRPVISTMVGGVRDLLGESVEAHEGFRVCERGIAVDEASPHAYTNGLIYLAKNEKLRDRLALGGRKFAAAVYSKERLLEDIKRLYRELAEGA